MMGRTVSVVAVLIVLAAIVLPDTRLAARAEGPGAIYALTNSLSTIWLGSRGARSSTRWRERLRRRATFVCD